MIFKIKQWLTQESQKEEQVTSQQAIALLLFEAATADYQFEDDEKRQLLTGMSEGLSVSTTEAESLLAWATTQSQLSTSLYPFTSCLNTSLTQEEKLGVMKMLWQVAFADGRLDKYEEHYIRHIADLLYVPHSAYIDTKLAVKKTLAC